MFGYLFLEKDNEWADNIKKLLENDPDVLMKGQYCLLTIWDLHLMNSHPGGTTLIPHAHAPISLSIYLYGSVTWTIN